MISLLLQLSWKRCRWTSLSLNHRSSASRGTCLPAVRRQHPDICATGRQEVLCVPVRTPHLHTHTPQGSVAGSSQLLTLVFCLSVTSGENPRCTMSPASAFAIATAAAGHSSSQGRQGPRAMTVPEHGSGEWKWVLMHAKVPCWLFISLSGFSNSERTCDKEFIIRRAATNRVLNVLRHWVSKHSQVRTTIECLLNQSP